jgi:putative transposase
MSEHRPLTALTEKQLQQAMDRFQMIRPVLDGGVPLTNIATEQEIPIRTLHRWVKRYREQGLTGLARKERADRSNHRTTDDIVKLIEGLALQKPPPSIASLHRQVKKICKRHEWRIPSYSNVYKIVNQLEPALLTLAQQGTKRYKEVFDIIYRREASRSNEIWQADHTQLDIWILNEQDKPARPWLTIIIDDYSRAIAGYFLSFQHPSAMQTSLALRQAIWRKDDLKWQICGIPEIFYTDHGSDFTSRHMEQVGADLKMNLIFSIVGEPRGRGKIERFFETVNQMFLSEQPGYIPKGNKSLVQPKLSFNELDEQFKSFLLDGYLVRPHGGTGMAPQERWSRGGFLPQLPDTIEELDLLLLTVAKTRRVHQDGIRFQGYRYMDMMLSAYVGEEVIIRYDPRDLAEIRIFLNNQFLCRAICEEISGQKMDIKEVIRARNRRRKQLTSRMKDRTEMVETYLSIHRSEPNQQEKQKHPPKKENSSKSKLKRYFNE